MAKPMPAKSAAPPAKATKMVPASSTPMPAKVQSTANYKPQKGKGGKNNGKPTFVAADAHANTHDQGGVVYHDSMAGYHDMPVGKCKY